MKKRLFKAIGVILLIAIFFFFAKAISNNWTRIKDYQFQINLVYVISASLLIILIVTIWGYLWKLILRDLGANKLSTFESIKIHIYSWVGKYIPGKIGMVGAKIYLGKQKGIDARILIVSTLYENIFQIISAFLVSIPILSYFSMQEFKGNELIYILVPIFFITSLIILIHTKLFFKIINRGLRLIKQEHISDTNFLSKKRLRYYILFYSLSYILNGIAFFLFINSITKFPISHLLPVIGTINFAGVIGLLAIFAPAGIGVREGIIILLLQKYLTSELVIIIAVLSRFWYTIIDGVFLLFLFLSSVISGKKV